MAKAAPGLEGGLYHERDGSPVKCLVRLVRRNAACWVHFPMGSAMTEYVINEIGHQWIVYADRLSIGACANETEAVQLITEDSRAKARTRNSADHKSSNTIQNPVGCWQAARAMGLASS